MIAGVAIVAAAASVAVAGAAAPRSPEAFFAKLGATAPTRADVAGFNGNYWYDASLDQPPTSEPVPLSDLLNTSARVAREGFVGAVSRGFTDFFDDGPDTFIVARSHADATWFATTHHAGLDSSAKMDSEYNDPGTILYDDSGAEVAVAVRGDVVVIAFADGTDPAYVEAEDLLSIGLRYLARVAH